MKHPLWPAVPLHCCLECFDHHVSALGIVDPVSDDKPAAIIKQDQRKRRGAVDMFMDEIKMPQVIGPNGFKAFNMRVTLYLWRPVPCILHHPTRRMHRNFDALAAQLISNLAWTQPRMAMPLVQNLLVALPFDLLHTRPRRG